jgi:UDP-N-acetylglucosamine:LPS N-acetylglucosamine transferase
MANARELERAGACVVVPDADLAADLAPALQQLLSDRQRRCELAAAAARRGQPDAADRIWEHCRGWLGESGT